MMNATEFEFRHQTLVHQLIVGAAVLTYLIDADDIVWRFVKDSATPHPFERLVFIVATLFIAVGAVVCTRARVHASPSTSVQPRYIGDLLYAVGLASLVPLSGFVVLVVGEALRIVRLVLRERAHAWNLQHPSLEVRRTWAHAIRREIVKWGILVTMIVFVITLQDRQADVLVVLSFLLGMLLNTRLFTQVPQKRAANV